MFKSLILLLLATNSYANITDIGSVKCFDKLTVPQNEVNEEQTEQIKMIEGEFCTYTVENLANVNELSRKVVQALFNGRPLIYPEGVLEAFGNNDQTLIFSHENINVLEQMKNVIPLLDAKESFAPNDVVRIKADIYEVNESGLVNLGAGISNLRFGTGVNDGVSDSTVVSSDGGGLGVDLRAGILELSGLIQAEKVKGNIRRVSQIRGDSYNLNSYNFSDITKVYQAPGAGTSISEEEEGIKLSAKVSINDVSKNTVVLKDFNFYYGVGEDRVNGDGRTTRQVNQISIPLSRLFLQEGVLIPVLSENISVESTQRSRGFLNYGRQSAKESSRLLIYFSVDVMTWNEYIAELNAVDTSNIQDRFTAEQRAELPVTCPTERELLSAIELYSRRGDDGEPVLSFGLDQSMACKSNIRKRIHVNTRGGGTKYQDNTHVLTVEQLMHIPIKINGIENRYFQGPWIEFTVAINFFRNTRSTVYHNLVYSRTTNYDISDNFWIE